MSNALKYAEATAKAALADLDEVGGELQELAERALTAQLIAASKKTLGVDTSLEDAAIQAAYHNIALAASIEVVEKVNGLFRGLVETVVHEVFTLAATA